MLERYGLVHSPACCVYKSCVHERIHMRSHCQQVLGLTDGSGVYGQWFQNIAYLIANEHKDMFPACVWNFQTCTTETAVSD